MVTHVYSIILNPDCSALTHMLNAPKAYMRGTNNSFTNIYYHQQLIIRTYFINSCYHETKYVQYHDYGLTHLTNSLGR